MHKIIFMDYDNLSIVDTYSLLKTLKLVVYSIIYNL